MLVLSLSLRGNTEWMPGTAQSYSSVLTYLREIHLKNQGLWLERRLSD